MARFAVAIADPVGPRQYEGLASEIREEIHAAGHSCSIWSAWQPECTIKEFIESALAAPEPVCICYVGHGLPQGWYYDRKKGQKKIYSYRVMGKAVAGRKGIPTAIISDCCHAGLIGKGFSGSGFDRLNTIALTASSSDRPCLITPDLAKIHTGLVFKSWFKERKPFNPFDHVGNCVFNSVDPRRWEEWLRLGPERFGPQKVDEHFFSKSP